MNTTTDSTTENSNTPAFPDASQIESFANLAALLEKKKRMIASIEALPQEIKTAREAAAAARQAVVTADVAYVAQADEPTDTQRCEHEMATAALTRQAFACDEQVQRLEGRLAALEPAIGRIDDEIEVEAQIVRNDANCLTSQLADACEPEIDRAVALLLPVLARIAALAEINRSGGAGYIAASAYLPAAHHVFRPVGLGAYDCAQNRLQLDDATMAAARAEVGPAMQPVREALALVATHKRYVPAAPYTRRGQLVEYSSLPLSASEPDYK